MELYHFLVIFIVDLLVILKFSGFEHLSKGDLFMADKGFVIQDELAYFTPFHEWKEAVHKRGIWLQQKDRKFKNTCRKIHGETEELAFLW